MASAAWFLLGTLAGVLLLLAILYWLDWLYWRERP